MIGFSWQPYPQKKPTLGFGLYPVKLKTGNYEIEYDLVYYYPNFDEHEKWQKDGVSYCPDVIFFLDLTVYPETAIRMS